jgi:hypothetical protein
MTYLYKKYRHLAFDADGIGKSRQEQAQARRQKCRQIILFGRDSWR